LGVPSAAAVARVIALGSGTPASTAWSNQRENIWCGSAAMSRSSSRARAYSRRRSAREECMLKDKLRRGFAAGIMAPALGALLAAGTPAAAQSGTLSIGGVARSYLVHLPAQRPA